MKFDTMYTIWHTGEGWVTLVLEPGAHPTDTGGGGGGNPERGRGSRGPVSIH